MAVPDTRLAHLLGGLLLTAGTAHFAIPAPFDSIIPDEIPADPRQLTYASGAAELGIGAALLVPRTRRLGGALAAALFLAVFPANLHMVRLWKDRGIGYQAVAIGRLPLQIPLVWAGIRVARGDRRRN